MKIFIDIVIVPNSKLKKQSQIYLFPHRYHIAYHLQFEHVIVV